jgi:hypothetical protein
MYGVPDGLDLSFLHGAELIQVCLGLSQIQLHFLPDGNISVEGEWELLGADGAIFDRSEPSPRSRAFQLHRLLGKQVVQTQVTPPTSVTLRFEGGDLLRIFDSSTQYESFSIQPGDIFI